MPSGASLNLCLKKFANVQSFEVNGRVAISTPTPEPLPTEKPHKTIEKIENTWEANGYLDRTHLTLGMNCKTCHNQEWPPHGPPNEKVCLDCHGGSYEAIAAQTDRDLNPHEVNIHNPDLDQVACSKCHLIHEPFVDPCSDCH